MRVAPAAGERLVCGRRSRGRFEGHRGVTGFSLLAIVARPEPADDGDGSGHLGELAGENEGEEKGRNVWRLFGQNNRRLDVSPGPFSPSLMMATTETETRGSPKKRYASWGSLGSLLSQQLRATGGYDDDERTNGQRTTDNGQWTNARGACYR